MKVTRKEVLAMMPRYLVTIDFGVLCLTDNIHAAKYHFNMAKEACMNVRIVDRIEGLVTMQHTEDV